MYASIRPRPRGTASSTSLVRAMLVAVCSMSTTGLSPVTVTVSSSALTPITTSISAVNPTVRRCSSRTTVWNPGSSNMIW